MTHKQTVDALINEILSLEGDWNHLSFNDVHFEAIKAMHEENEHLTALALQTEVFREKNMVLRLFKDHARNTIKELEKENERLKALNKQMCEAIDMPELHNTMTEVECIASMAEKNERYEKALKFYASEKNTTNDLYFDGGCIARKALNQEEGE